MASKVSACCNIQISIVIATYNRADHLAQCLETLDSQDWDRSRFEVIVVNDGSSDKTAEVISTFARCSHIRFRTFSHPNSGVSVSRNVGILQSEGEFVAFTDDDCRLPPWWLSRLASHLENLRPNVVGIGGPLDCSIESGSSLATNFIKFVDEFNYVPVLDYFRVKPIHVSHLSFDAFVPYLRTSNALFRKCSLLAVGGFSVEFRRPGGEDPDLCYRLLKNGGCFLFDRNLVVNHVSRASFSEYFRSLNNYVIGDFICRGNRSLYSCRAIQRTYEFIPLQKLLSCVLSLFAYPFVVVKLIFFRQVPFVGSLLFPLILIVSKVNAFFIAINCQFYEWQNRKVD